MTAQKRTFVKRSPIAGRGLFAGQRFKRGDLIIKAQCKRGSISFGAYSVEAIDGTAHTILNNARFLNHAMPPNAILWDDDTVTALRKIERGQEITVDYGEGRRP